MFYVFVIVVALALFLFFVSRKADRFSLSRSIAINATARDIFPWINNVRRFNEWNPWAAMDATSSITYAGTEEGPGASYSWVGKKTGEGSMTLKDADPPAAAQFALEFIKPFKASNIARFSLQETGGATTVTWTMTGANSFFNKLFQTFVSMDKMVGKDFEKGLASLKQRVESKTLS
jgi:Polyketide cyclase / dehydrase and lipid transport